MKRGLLAVLFLLGVSTSTTANSYKEVRDWYVYCTHGLTCQLQTQLKADGVYSFGFERGPRAEAAVIPLLSMSGDPVSGSRIKLTIDGDEDKMFVLPSGAITKEDGVHRFSVGETASELLEAMMAGKSMSLRVNTDKGEVIVDVSLSGITAGALYVDEVQGRLGNQDALQAKGEGVPQDAKTRVTELKARKQLPAEVDDVWSRDDDNCSLGLEENADLVAEFGAISIALGEGFKLYILPCGLPGAYNYPQTIIAHDEKYGGAREMSLPVMGRKGPSLVDYVYNTSWDDRNSTLSAFFKGRGIGDCGTRQTWEWPGGGFQSNFELIEEYVKGTCDGEFENWPRTWPPE